MKRLLRLYTEDRGIRAGISYLCVALAGFVVIGFAWRGAARTINVSLQLPLIISGGVGGLALVIIGSALFVINYERRTAGSHRVLVDDLKQSISTTTQRIAALSPPSVRRPEYRDVLQVESSLPTRASSE